MMHERDRIQHETLHQVADAVVAGSIRFGLEHCLSATSARPAVVPRCGWSRAAKPSDGDLPHQIRCSVRFGRFVGNCLAAMAT